MTDKEIQPKHETRSHYKKEKKEKARGEKVRIRLIPIWLRVILILFAVIISVVSGLIVGYGVIGDGNPFDALSKSTWTHIVELVNKK